MSSLFSQLAQAAEEIGQRLEAKTKELEAQYAETEAHLLKLKHDIALAKTAPERKGLLLDLYSLTERPVCPECYLEKSFEVELVPEDGTKDEDSWACPRCGYRETVEA